MNGVKSGALHRSCSERRPQDARFCAPAFDVTPARYIAGIITERGVIAPVNEETVRAVVES